MTLNVSDPALIDVAGRLWWLFADGTLLPMVRGGADDAGQGGDGGSGPGDGSGGGGDTAGGSGSGDAAGSGGTDGGSQGGKVTFTPEQQAHIDKLIERNTGKSMAKAEQEFRTWLDQQAMGETDRLKAEKTASDKLVEETKLEALTTKVETAAERYAIGAGVKPDRVTKFMRLVDLDMDKLSDGGKPDNDAIKALIEAEVADNPEFKSAGSNGAGKSGGEFNGSGDKKVWTRKEIAQLSPEEYDKHEAEIMAQLQAGTIK